MKRGPITIAGRRVWRQHEERRRAEGGCKFGGNRNQVSKNASTTIDVRANPRNRKFGRGWD